MRLVCSVSNGPWSKSFLIWKIDLPFYIMWRHIVVPDHFTAHSEMTFAVIILQFDVIILQFAVIILQFAVII